MKWSKKKCFNHPKPKMPRVRILLTFLVKTEDLQLLKVMCECKFGTEGYNDIEKVKKSNCENWVKSSIILLLKNVWSFNIN